MAVESRNLSLFHPQLITNRNRQNEGNGGIYNNSQMGSGVGFIGASPETLFPFPQSFNCESVPVKAPVKADSGVTYNVPSAPRKRYRDYSFENNNQIGSNNNFSVPQENHNSLSDIPIQIFQQQVEIDHMVAQHTKKLRLELEERQKQQARLLVSAIGEGMAKKLKEKDEQIQRMGKMNWVLQERVKSLFAENQLWRDLAQSNEATANSLRSNLEQVLAAHVSDNNPFSAAAGGRGAAAVVVDDAESCCGSSDDVEVEVERSMQAGHGGDGEGVKDKEVVVGGGCGGGSGSGGKCDKGMCKRCGERESSVLLMPCRHLCLCTLCGSSLIRTCPVCNSAVNVTLHVNLS